MAGLPPRKGFIDKEVDKESELGDFGVRKYDDEIGRFLSADPLWEKYRAWTPYQYGLNNPLMLQDPSGKDADVVVDMNAKTIEIATTIYIYGSGANATLASQMQTDIMSEWNRSWTYTDKNGVIYTVNFNITVQVYNPSDPNDGPDLISSKNLPWNTDNYIEVGPNVARSFVMGGDEGEWRSTGMGGRSFASTDPAPHEFGHLIGLDDRYTGSTPDAGWAGNVMAEAAMSGSVEQRNIDAVLNGVLTSRYYELYDIYNIVVNAGMKVSGHENPSPIFKTKIDESYPSW